MSELQHTPASDVRQGPVADHEPVSGTLPDTLTPLALFGRAVERERPLLEQATSIDPARVLELQRDPANSEIQMQVARALFVGSEKSPGESPFEKVLTNLRWGSGDESGRLPALKELLSTFSHFSALTPDRPLATDSDGDTITAGEHLVRALPETTRIAGNFGELLELFKFPVPADAEWQAKKDTAICMAIGEGSYGKGFLYLKPSGSDLRALGDLFSVSPGVPSLAGVMADALRNTAPGNSCEAGIASFASNLSRITRETPEAFEFCVQAAALFGTPLKTIVATAHYLEKQEEKYRSRDPFGHADTEILLAASKELAGIPVEQEVRLGKARLDEAFKTTSFATFREFLDYADPKRVAGFRDGQMHWQEQQDVAIKLFDWLGPAARGAINAHLPGAAELRELMEVLCRFSRGQLHEHPSGGHIYPVMEEMAKLAFARAQSADDWQTIAAYRPQAASQFEGQRIGLIYEALPQLFACGDTSARIKGALESLNSQHFQPAIDVLSRLPEDARPAATVSQLVKEIRSTDGLDKQIQKSLRALCDRLVSDYEGALTRQEEGTSREELVRMRREARSTSWFGRRINELTAVWPV